MIPIRDRDPRRVIIRSSSYPPSKYYYYEPGGYFNPEGHYDRPITKGKNFPYIKSKVIDIIHSSDGNKKIVRISRYIGDNHLSSVEASMSHNSKDAAARMMNAQKLLRVIKEELDDLHKNIKPAVKKKLYREDIVMKKFKEYYNPNENYGPDAIYLPDPIIISDGSIRNMVQERKDLALLRKKKSKKIKANRKPVKRKCRCKK